jgi:hypothetical protein
MICVTHGYNALSASIDTTMKICILLFTVGVFSSPTSAQIGTGTIIVFHVTKNKFIIAADSRAVFKGQPEDSDCKIAVLNHQFIFATSGGAGYRPATEGFDPAPAFDNTEEARKAVRARPSNDAGDDLNRVADGWAENMIRDFRSLYSIHPETVVEAGRNGKGTLANGLFAKAIKGKIVLAFRSISFSQDRPELVKAESIPQDCAARICATGITDVFDEYTSFPQKSERAKREGILNPTTDETARIKRLVQLSILHTRPTGEVGGPIDVLELWNNGRIRWVSRKCNCPENKD